jgi:hypothetical protein
MRRSFAVAVVIVLWNGLTMISAPGFQTQHSLDPTVVDPTHFKVELENEYVRVIRGKVEPGHQVTHAHPAPGAVIVALTSAELRLTLSDGSSRQIAYKAGDARLVDNPRRSSGRGD